MPRRVCHLHIPPARGYRTETGSADRDARGPPPAGETVASFAWLVRACDPVGHRITHAIEEPAAAMLVPPSFGVHAAWIGPFIKKRGPFSVRRRRRVTRPCHMGFAAIMEFDLRSEPAPGARDQQHQCETAAAAASSIRRPVRNRSKLNGAAIGCGSPRATVEANTCPDPGVALKPPVP